MSGINNIQFPLNIFMPGEVVRIKFPFEDDPKKYKERSAIIVDTSKDKVKIMLLKVTTHAPRNMYDYALRDHTVAKLRAGSVVRCNHVIELPGAYKCNSIGHLSINDFNYISALYMNAIRHGDIVGYRG